MRQGDALGVHSAECCDAQRRGGRYPVREHALSNSDADGAGRRWELPGASWYPVLEGECDMRVPQVSERIKEAPAHALRGVFAGIGQLLLITDKLRNKASHQDVPRARTPEASETVTDRAVTSPAGNGAGTAAEAGPAPAPVPPPAPAEAGGGTPPCRRAPGQAGPRQGPPRRSRSRRGARRPRRPRRRPRKPRA